MHTATHDVLHLSLCVRAVTAPSDVNVTVRYPVDELNTRVLKCLKELHPPEHVPDKLPSPHIALVDHEHQELLWQSR